jgi:HJR/Mrr/RecB family endonuclease
MRAFVAYLFESKGYAIDSRAEALSVATDLIVRLPNMIPNFRAAVDCRKVRADRHLGVEAVQELHNSARIRGVNCSILVTTSYFTKEAFSHARQYGRAIRLIDRNELLTLALEVKVLERDKTRVIAHSPDTFAIEDGATV